MKITRFSVVYNSFLSKITDDMYLELTEEDTELLLRQLLISAIPNLTPAAGIPNITPSPPNPFTLFDF